MAKLVPLLRPKSKGYLLNDSFFDTLAAGSVNNTNATPGPGRRTVVDTTNLLSIGSGVATFGNPGVASGNPGIWYAAITRVAGLVLVGSFTPVDGNCGMRFGWDSNQTGDATDRIGFFSSGFFRLLANGGTSVNTIPFTLGNTLYRLALVVRASGYYFFVKGASYTNWTLIYFTDISSGVIYPMVGSGTVSTACAVDNVRVPIQTWLPTPLAYDSFTRADGALTQTQAAGPDAQPCTALDYNAINWTVSTNKAVANPTYGVELASGNLVPGQGYQITATQANYFYTGCAIGDCFVAQAATALNANNKVKCANTMHTIGVVDTGKADVLIAADLTFEANKAAGLVARVNSLEDPTYYLMAWHDRTNAYLAKIEDGAYTNLITAAAAYSAGAKLVLVVQGTSAELYYNNARIGSVQTVPASSDTIHGMYGLSPSNSIDNFVCFPRGTGGEHVVLNSF